MDQVTLRVDAVDLDLYDWHFEGLEWLLITCRGSAGIWVGGFRWIQGGFGECSPNIACDWGFLLGL